ncbi:MAG: sensor histidine kinase [Ignavibacteriae bacterium]|nr:MAG: sensor histidine kinase [Ignavibacteriota bacterium]
MKARIYNKLSIKLVIITSLVLITALSIHTYLTIRFFEENLINISKEGAYATSDIIKRSTRYSMLLNRREDLTQTTKTIGNEPGIKKVRIYNKTGVIAYSSDSTEIGKIIDKSSDACIGCHNTPNSKPRVNAPDTRLFMMENERVLGLINPIKNESDCYTASCHAHKSTEELVGVLDVLVSMKSADETIATATKNIIFNSVIITALISALSGIFIFLLVNKPLNKFKKAIEELGKGNLNYRVHIKNKNEFGIIAYQFNDMSKKLSLAYREIKDWSETLNEKVEVKTQELKNIYDQIVQIEKLTSLGKLSATVAHELNNPLEGILTFSRLITKKLARENNDEHIKLIQYAKMISDEASRCGKIVKDLLLFSHSDTEEFITSDLICLLDKSISLINHHFEINNIKLEKIFDTNELIIKCNPQKIQQMMISILINAIESMSGRNEGKITIKLTKEDKKAIIRISDTGFGISEKDLPYIFEPFYTTKEMAKGTGLGLSIVYGIVNQHKGKIEVEETSILGTTFKISLPIN